METVEHQPNRDSTRRLLPILGAITIGYAVALVEGLSETVFPYSPLKLAAIALIGVVYTYLLIKDEFLLSIESRPERKATYFLIMLVLLGLTFWLVDTLNGIWLIAMPLVGTAVAILPRYFSWLLSLAILALMLLPATIDFGIQTALSIGVSLAPAFVFVIVFVRLWLDADEARQKAQTLADQLEGANRQLSAYATQAEELATTKERNRLAREIHDSLGHYLTVINVQIEAARTIMGQQPERAGESLKKAQALTQEGLASVRQSVAALRESPLNNRPLSAAIDDLADETRNAGLVAEFEIKGDVRPLEQNTELTLYRAVQEGLTNVRKHARASRVDLILDYQEAEQITLLIKDNGVGSAETNNGGFGLLGVRERVKLLGGTLAMETSPGSGFQLTVVLPG